jgi:hypothetical protein
LAVIIAARGVTLSSNFLSGRLETDTIALHCDERYQPCGLAALRLGVEFQLNPPLIWLRPFPAAFQTNFYTNFPVAVSIQ